MVRVALRAYATAFRPLYYLFRVAGKLDGRIDLLAEFRQCPLKRLCLRHGARKSIQHHTDPRVN